MSVNFDLTVFHFLGQFLSCSYLRCGVIGRRAIEQTKPRPLRKLFKDLEPQRQVLLDVGGLLPHLELLDLLGLLVELEVVEDDRDEERHHDQGHEEMEQRKVDGHQRGQGRINLKWENHEKNTSH